MRPVIMLSLACGIAGVAIAQEQPKNGVPNYDVPIHGKGKTIDTPDGKLYYEQEGKGPVIVMVAGGPGGDHTSFHPFFSRLAKDHTVVYFDNIGRGRSDRLKDKKRYTVWRDAEDIERLRKALGQDKITVIDAQIAEHHDLILLDLSLGETDGMTVMRTLADKQAGANLVLLTGADQAVINGARKVAELSGFNVVAACAKSANITQIEGQFPQAPFPTMEEREEFVKDWINTRKADLERRLNYAQQQTAGGGTAGQAAPVKPVRRYNPATGTLE